MTEERPFTVASFNRFLAERKLMASRCTACGSLHLPPRAVCPGCYADRMEWVAMAGRGRLAAFTAVHIGLSTLNAEGYDRDNPYCSGVVELDEGVRISARIEGVDARNPHSIQVGMPLQVDFIEQGPEDKRRTVLAFRP
jgi:hypothetical protein